MAELSTASRIGLILGTVAETRSLAVLDNLESSLDPQTGATRESALGELLEAFSERVHVGKLVVTTRVLPTLRPRDRAVRTLVLEGLDGADAVRLLQSDGVEGPAELVGETVRRLGCNPRLIRFLADIVVRRYGRSLERALRHRPDLATDQARKFVDDIWQSLSSTACHTLRVLATSKGPVAPDELGALVAAVSPGESPDEVDDAVWIELVPRALVAPQDDPYGVSVEHELIRERVLDLWSERAEANKTLARLFREKAASSPESSRELLGRALHHALLCTDQGLAAEILLRTELGDRFSRRTLTARDEEQLRSFCERFPLSRTANDADRLDAHRRWAAVLLHIGDRAAARRLIGQCLECLDSAHGTPLAARILIIACACYRQVQRFDEAEKAGLEARRLAEGLGLVEEQIDAMLELAGLDRNRGRPRQAAHLAIEAHAIAIRTGDDELLVVTEEFLGKTYASAGDVSRSKAHYERAIEAARRAGRRRSEGRIMGRLADLALDVRDYDRALELACAALERRLADGDLVGAAIDRTCYAFALLGLDRVDEALEQLRTATRTPLDLGHHREVSARLVNLAAVFQRRGEMVVALACLQTGVDMHRVWRVDMRKWSHRIAALRAEAEGAGADWAAIETAANESRFDLLERASGIPAQRWRSFLADLGPRV